jgi:hypothetical protein
MHIFVRKPVYLLIYSLRRLIGEDRVVRSPIDINREGSAETAGFFAESTWLYHTVRQQGERPRVATGPGPFNQL